jgi:hypothetical protein
LGLSATYLALQPIRLLSKEERRGEERRGDVRRKEGRNGKVQKRR